MKKKEKDDIPRNISRFNVMQVPDFSFSDGTNIESVRPAKAKRPRIKAVIENTKPQT